MLSNCEACGGHGVQIKVIAGAKKDDDQHISIPCKVCSGKNKCPSCGRRVRSKNHQCAGSKSGRR